MRLWRLTRAAHAAAPLSGHGAAIAGGRWNSPGVRIAYTSTSRPLAVLEMLVHVTRDTIPPDMMLIPIDVPDRWIAQPERLPADWSNLPFSAAARKLGDSWVHGARSLALTVPSMVLPAERNVLINPEHPQMSRVRVLSPEPFVFDRRLLR
ncbi:MAG TPA: RES family NAD+ phosphorylase [Burkholderiales bacterium]|nr:RES family NAD+ phosphorylase [Burkholderiales bacterium]